MYGNCLSRFRLGNGNNGPPFLFPISNGKFDDTDIYSRGQMPAVATCDADIEIVSIINEKAGANVACFVSAVESGRPGRTAPGSDTRDESTILPIVEEVSVFTGNNEVSWVVVEIRIIGEHIFPLFCSRVEIEF